ncbi:hypothetical protein [Psychrobacter sp. GP33]|uniref:hypothetical protein n=1 Tax=Psychrobacter sp. GP33 TaxID=2758709 RepID=UPI002174EFF5|nr:hypothetical protein [Psychrobacter sp. GP33]
MGIWIAVAIVLFVLGSMMALKPSGIDQRLDRLRMTARRLGLNPKLVACPDWVKGKDHEYGRGMLGQYGLVLDNVQMPHSRYQAIDGQWRPDTSLTDSNQTMPSSFYLDKTPLKLPASIEPFVKALLIKANSIVIYWEDIAYVRPSTNPSYKSFEIEPDLLVLKAQLEQWALQMQASPRRPYDSRDMDGNDVYSRGINSQGVNSKMLNKNF